MIHALRTEPSKLCQQKSLNARMSFPIHQTNHKCSIRSHAYIIHVDRPRLTLYMIVVQPIQNVDQHFTIALSVTV